MPDEFCAPRCRDLGRSEFDSENYFPPATLFPIAMISNGYLFLDPGISGAVVN